MRALEEVEVRERRRELVTRIRVLTGLLVALLIAVASGFWFVQIVHGNHYRTLAENNRLKKQPIEPVRGLIYDRHHRLLAENVPSYHLLINRSRTHDLESSLAFAAAILERPAAELRSGLDRYRSVASFTPVPLAENLTFEQVARFGVISFEHPEFEISVRHLRFYRRGLDTAHVLGYLGEVTESELQRPGNTRVPGDLVGRRGVEQAYDARLQGHGGQRIVVVDSRGRMVEEHADSPAQPGENLTLTLDLELQQAAFEAMKDRVGAVIALDPRDGAIRAMVSTPSYDPNLFSRPLSPAQWKELVEAPNDPLQNRTVQTTHAPGSVFKVVVALAGLGDGLIGTQETVFCDGSTTLYNHRFRCWNRNGHGRVSLIEAIKNSCDVFFYHLGQRLGIERIARYSHLLGLGQTTGIDQVGEKPGLVPDSAWSLRQRHSRWYPGETISVAIGQGPLLTTPLQIAVLYAMVANGGHPIRPHVVADAELPPLQPPVVKPELLALVRRGLWAVVNDEGTGRRAALRDIVIAGKTGTAQVVQQKTWTHNQALPPELRDHAWFASYAPADDPELVVVVFLEHGGAGSEAAAPVAKALYEIYFRDRLQHRAAA